uniref:Uncharacterized protein n=1 Tax=Arundo donax TaxID=35708 RepID=A0A0A9C9J8_ARUDO
MLARRPPHTASSLPTNFISWSSPRSSPQPPLPSPFSPCRIRNGSLSVCLPLLSLVVAPLCLDGFATVKVYAHRLLWQPCRTPRLAPSDFRASLPPLPPPHGPPPSTFLLPLLSASSSNPLSCPSPQPWSNGPWGSPHSARAACCSWAQVLPAVSAFLVFAICGGDPALRSAGWLPRRTMPALGGLA